MVFIQNELVRDLIATCLKVLYNMFKAIFFQLQTTSEQQYILKCLALMWNIMLPTSKFFSQTELPYQKGKVIYLFHAKIVLYKNSIKLFSLNHLFFKLYENIIKNLILKYQLTNKSLACHFYLTFKNTIYGSLATGI